MILEAFGNSNRALSVVELVDRFQHDMNKTTVYRILERLENENILHSFSGVNGLKRFARTLADENEHAPHDHTHFQCQECGKSECLAVNVPIPNVPGHAISSASLILVGQCPECLA